MDFATIRTHNSDLQVESGQIYLIRHAESTYNSARLGQGGYTGNANKDLKFIDAKLTTKGIT